MRGVELQSLKNPPICLFGILTSRIKVCAVLIVVIVALRFLMPTQGQVQTTYWIATYAASWSDPRVQISIPSSPPILHDTVSKAIGIWNQALLWFQSTYFSNSITYVFMANAEETGVTVQAVDDATLEKYCQFSSVSQHVGCAPLKLEHGDYGDMITSADIYLLASSASVTNQNLLFELVFSLGLVLGLAEYPSTCSFQDLMCGNNPSPVPSTLDLYAAHLLVEEKGTANVTLPANIPFQQAPIPVPEFHGNSVLLTFTFFSAFALLATRKKKRP